MYILGIHPGGHDTSATLLRDGKIIIAIEEERLSKKKTLVLVIIKNHYLISQLSI